jgi:phage protein D
MAEGSSGIRIARPVIAIDDTDEPSLSDGLISLVITEDTSGLYRCEATFGNWGANDASPDYLYFDRRKLDFGKGLKIKYDGATLFDGRVMALEAQFHDRGARNINVLAEDRFQDLRMTRRTRSFEDTSDADVFSRIANDHGLSPEVDVSGPTHKVLSQVNQSDLAFMRERARSLDAEIWMDGSKLYVKSHAGRDAGTRKMAYGRELYEFSVIADLAHQRTSVFVNGWDVAGKTGLQYEATDSVVSGELNGGVSGASVLQKAFGQRKEAVAHTVPLTAQEAQTEAESYFKMMARRFVVGRGVCDASSKLRVGAYVELDAVGKLFNGKYYLTEVRHLFDYAHGIRTAFKAERPSIGNV